MDLSALETNSPPSDGSVWLLLWISVFGLGTLGFVGYFCNGKLVR